MKKVYLFFSQQLFHSILSIFHLQGFSRYVHKIIHIDGPWCGFQGSPYKACHELQ